MLDTLKELLAHQYEASLSTLNLAVVRCPDANWNERIANLTFSQAAFHVAIFTDLYLQPSDDPEAFRHQPFHIEHQAVFRDYEEFEDRPPVLLYEKPFILSYIQTVRRNAQETIARESAAILAGPSGFRWRKCSRAELHVYNIRHIQHHAALWIETIDLLYQQSCHRTGRRRSSRRLAHISRPQPGSGRVATHAS